MSLDNGVSDEFHDTEKNERNKEENEEEMDSKENMKKIKYDNVVIEPLLFQDDIANATDNVEDAQKANDKIDKVMEKKLLNLNLGKSSFLITGAKKARKDLENQVKANPLTLSNSNMREVKETKYLGIWLSGSVAGSVAATVSHRLGLASRSIYEIKAVIEDSRADSLGAVEVGLTLWEQSIMPMLLYGLETFNNIPKKIMKQLDDLNNRFLKALLGVGKNGCPLPSLYLETAPWAIKNRILF